VPLDSRSLDYGGYVEEGDRTQAGLDDYTSHNTERLDVDRVLALLRDVLRLAVPLGETS
jgi:UDP-N-acetylglucosamine 4,6-dehydratase